MNDPVFSAPTLRNHINLTKWLVAFLLAGTPIAANAVVTFLGAELGPKTDTGKTVIVEDIVETPTGITTVAIPFPVIKTQSKDPVTNKTTTETKVVVTGEKTPVPSRGGFFISRGVLSPGNLNFFGAPNLLIEVGGTGISDEETASFSVALTNPETERPIGTEYLLEITGNGTKRATFDLAVLPEIEFNLVFRAIQTSKNPSPESTLFVSEIAIDGVSIASAFSVSEVPVPATLWLFGSALVGLTGLSKRRRGRNS